MHEAVDVVVRVEAGALWATVKQFPGVFATGDTPEELRKSLAEGISLYLATPGQAAPRVHVDSLTTELKGSVVVAFDYV